MVDERRWRREGERSGGEASTGGGEGAAGVAVVAVDCRLEGSKKPEVGGPRRKQGIEIGESVVTVIWRRSRWHSVPHIV